jgi:hypothetical protein
MLPPMLFLGTVSSCGENGYWRLILRSIVRTGIVRPTHWPRKHEIHERVLISDAPIPSLTYPTYPQSAIYSPTGSDVLVRNLQFFPSLPR